MPMCMSFTTLLVLTDRFMSRGGLLRGDLRIDHCDEFYYESFVSLDLCRTAYSYVIITLLTLILDSKCKHCLLYYLLEDVF